MVRGGTVGPSRPANAERGPHARHARCVELRRHVGHEQHFVRLLIERRGDVPVTRCFPLGPVVVSK